MKGFLQVFLDQNELCNLIRTIRYWKLELNSENYRNIHSHKSCIGGKRYLSKIKEEEVKWFLMVGKISVHQQIKKKKRWSKSVR